MAEQKQKKGVNFKDLNIGQIMEADRIEVDSRGAFQILKFYIDEKTQYYDKSTQTGGILKFDGIDIPTGEFLKYRTTSRVLIETFSKMMEVIGCKTEKDENGIEWNVFKEPVNIDGIEMVPSKVKGHKPYPKIIIN